MNWKLTKVPKVVHLYWGRNVPMSFLRYCTPLTLRRMNPDLRIIMHYPSKVTTDLDWKTHEHKDFSYSGQDYFDRLGELDIEMNEVDFTVMGVKDSLPEVCKSDIYRYYLMAEHGGLWADMDIIFIKPIDGIANRELADYIYSDFTFGINCRRMGKKKGFRMSLNALLFAMPHSKYYSDVFEYALQAQHKEGDNYQRLGVIMLNDFADLHDLEMGGPITSYKKEKGYIMPYSTVLPIGAWDIPLLYEGMSTLSDRAIGVHWFAGHQLSSQWEGTVTEENYYDYSNRLLFGYLYKALNQEVPVEV